MANKFGKGIPLTTGFDLGTTGPLDSRTVVDNLDLLYPGLLVYVIEENQNYQYNGTVWQTLKVEGDMSIPGDDVDLSNYYTAPQVDAIVDTHANSMRDEISQTYALKKDVENFITEEEFNRGKVQIKSSFVFGNESTATQMLLYGKYLLLRDKVFNVEEKMKLYDDITLSEVNAVIKEIFGNNDISVACVSPEDSPIKI